MHPVLKTSLRLLHLIGINPYNRNWYQQISMVLHGMSMMAAFIINGMQLFLKWHGIRTFADANMISATWIMISKFLYVIMNQPKIIILIETVPKFWTYDKFDEENNKRISALLNRTMLAIKLLAGFVFVTAISLSAGGLYHRDMIFPGYEVCDFQNNLCYWPLMAWQAYYCYYELMCILTGFDGLFVSFIGYAYCDIEMIILALKKMPLVIKKNHLPVELREETPEEKKLVQSNLKEIIDEHSQIMYFIKELNTYYSPIMIIQTGSSFFSLIFCLYMVTVDGIPPKMEVVGQYGVLFFAVLLQFGIYSYFGTMILEQCKRLEYHFYDTEWWYKTQPDFRRSIMLMIERAQSTPKLKIASMNDLNMETYLLVVKNAFSYVALMRTMANSDKI